MKGDSSKSVSERAVMFPITQEAEIWNISSLDMYLAPHKISERALTILIMSKKNTCFLSSITYLISMLCLFFACVLQAVLCTKVIPHPGEGQIKGFSPGTELIMKDISKRIIFMIPVWSRL